MKFILTSVLFMAISLSYGQNPAITSWLQNTTETGSYYAAGNSTAVGNNILVNCQQVEYSEDYAYITCTGVPAYPTGPFQDGNPSQATNQNAVYRFPLNPEPNTGNNTETTPGTIGVFINGVSLYDYRDGVAWNPNTNALCGGPGNAPCPGGMGAENDWNRDAIPAESEGFDCAKGHPAMGNYHHHQNPTAFDLDQVEVSDVCNLYAADGLYVINPEVHSPLIGFAYDGYPIYGALGFTNVNGTGGITRMKSGYQLRNITERTTHADGTSVDNGPNVSDTYRLGYFREDYEFILNDGEDYLDEHNGRFSVTPEYPEGIYAYFCTVDESYNSAYPYAVGPTFYGAYSNSSVNAVSETTTVYTGTNEINEGSMSKIQMNVYPNPASELVAIQVDNAFQTAMKVELLDMTGKLVESTVIARGSTIAYFDLQKVYAGKYLVRVSGEATAITKELVIIKE